MPLRRYPLAFTIGLALVTLAACAAPPAANHWLTDADRTALRALDAQWAKAANAKDFAAIGALYAEEAVLFPPNAEAVKGRGAIQTYFQNFPPFSDMQLNQQELEGCGDIAYGTGTYAMMMTMPGAQAVPERGKYIEIFRKGPDGSWKLARDIFNSDMAAAEPGPAPTPGH